MVALTWSCVSPSQSHACRCNRPRVMPVGCHPVHPGCGLSASLPGPWSATGRQQHQGPELHLHLPGSGGPGSTQVSRGSCSLQEQGTRRMVGTLGRPQAQQGIRKLRHGQKGRGSGGGRGPGGEDHLPAPPSVPSPAPPHTSPGVLRLLCHLLGLPLSFRVIPPQSEVWLL